MMNALQTSGDEAKNERMTKAYDSCMECVVVQNARHAFPSFQQIFDEYATMVIEDRIQQNEQALLQSLHEQGEELFTKDVETFLEESMLQQTADLLHFLMDRGLTFEYEGKSVHSPLQEVW